MSENIVKFNKEFLLNELGLPWNPDLVIEDDILDSSRWSINYRLVFKMGDGYYITYYSVGATESQDETPWEDEKMVQCWPAMQRTVSKKVWVEK